MAAFDTPEPIQIVIGRAAGEARVSTACGDIRIGAIGAGPTVLHTGSGKLEAGAQVDARTGFGDVLIARAAPGPGQRNSAEQIPDQVS